MALASFLLRGAKQVLQEAKFVEPRCFSTAGGERCGKPFVVCHGTTVHRQSKNCADRQIFTLKGSRKTALLLEPSTAGGKHLYSGIAALLPTLLAPKLAWYRRMKSGFSIKTEVYGYYFYNSVRLSFLPLIVVLKEKQGMKGDQQHFHVDTQSSSWTASCLITWWPSAPCPCSLLLA